MELNIENFPTFCSEKNYLWVLKVNVSNHWNFNLMCLKWRRRKKKKKKTKTWYFGGFFCCLSEFSYSKRFSQTTTHKTYLIWLQGSELVNSMWGFYGWICLPCWKPLGMKWMESVCLPEYMIFHVKWFSAIFYRQWFLWCLLEKMPNRSTLCELKFLLLSKMLWPQI